VLGGFLSSGAAEIAESDHIIVPTNSVDSFILGPSVIAQIRQLFQYSSESVAIAFAYHEAAYYSALLGFFAVKARDVPDT
jgi:hypothetical protein